MLEIPLLFPGTGTNYNDLIKEKIKQGTAITEFSDIHKGDRLKITWPSFKKDVQIVWSVAELPKGDGLHVQLSYSWGTWIFNDPERLGLNFILATQPFRVLVEKSEEDIGHYERVCFRCSKTYYTTYTETLGGNGLCPECLKKDKEGRG